MPHVDLHMHTCYSRDSLASPESMVKRCIEVGLDCIAITDHNTIEGALAAKLIAPFQVIVGEEVKSADGDIVGLFLEEPIPKGLGAKEVVRRIKEQRGLVSIPHPFDVFRRGVIDKTVLREILPNVDMIEGFNARNILDQSNRSAIQLAKDSDTISTSVSDSHTPYELGGSYVKIDTFDGSPQGLMEALKLGALVYQKSSPLIHFLTAYAKMHKRMSGFLGKRQKK